MTLVESMYYRWSNISRFGIQGMLDCYIQSVTFFSEQVSRKKRPISFKNQRFLNIQPPMEPRDFRGFVDG